MSSEKAPDATHSGAGRNFPQDQPAPAKSSRNSAFPASQRYLSYKKLREIRHNEGGTVPNDVQALADLELAKVNLGQGQGQSADSVRSYLESYLTAGIGSKTRRKLRDVTIESYKRDLQRHQRLHP